MLKVHCALSCALAVGAASVCFADTTNTARVTINPNASGGGGPVDNIDSHSGTCHATGSSTGGFNSAGSGEARTTYGTIRVSGQATGTLNAAGRGIFRDSLTITSPGIPSGIMGTLTYSVAVSGQVSASAGASAGNWQLTADLGGGASDIGKTGYFFGPGLATPGYSGDPFGTYSATIDFQYGMPIPLYVECTASAQAAYSTSDQPGAATFGSPILCQWMGISNVLIFGHPAPSFTVTSESGTNYTGQINPPVDCPADLGGQGGLPGADGHLDNNDFVVFIDYFFNHNALADVGMQGGVPGHDNLWDNNDFVVYIDQFFAGC
jgi:hypothetical protein